MFSTQLDTHLCAHSRASVGLALRGSGRDKVEAMTIHDWRSHVMVQRNHEVVHTRARKAGCLPGLRSFLAWYWCSRTPAIVLHHELRVLFLLTRGLPNSFHFLTCVTRPVGGGVGLPFAPRESG